MSIARLELGLARPAARGAPAGPASLLALKIAAGSIPWPCPFFLASDASLLRAVWNASLGACMTSEDTSPQDSTSRPCCALRMASCTMQSLDASCKANETQYAFPDTSKVLTVNHVSKVAQQQGHHTNQGPQLRSICCSRLV